MLRSCHLPKCNGAGDFSLCPAAGTTIPQQVLQEKRNLQSQSWQTSNSPYFYFSQWCQTYFLFVPYIHFQIQLQPLPCKMCYKRSLANALIPLPTVPMAKSHDFKAKARDRAQLKAKAWRQLPFLSLWAVVHSPCSFQSQCRKINCQLVPPGEDSQGSWEEGPGRGRKCGGRASSPQLPQPVPVLWRRCTKAQGGKVPVQGRTCPLWGTFSEAAGELEEGASALWHTSLTRGSEEAAGTGWPEPIAGTGSA